nr:phage tail protein I [Hyphomicrobium sulfonivorans]
MATTPLNKALTSLSTRLEGINAPTREVWNPWTCPPDFLKALAHAFSVDLWVDDWTEMRKRRIIANAVEMHRQKGTLAGVLSYLSYVDATLLQVTVPPVRVFSGANLTREQRETWLGSLPQLRTWRMKEPGHKGFGLYSSGFAAPSFFERGFPIPSTALLRHRRRARWVVDGIETETRVSEFGSWFRLHLNGHEQQRVISGRIRRQMFFMPSTARERLVTIQPSPRLAWRSPVGPTLEPVASEPERVVEAGTRRHGVFSDTVGRGFFRPSTAGYRIYWRFPVHDGRRVHRRPTVQFMGVGRYGFPAHTAHLEILTKSKQSRWRAGEGIHLPGTRFWMPHNPAPMQNVRRALVAAKRASDEILIRYPERNAFVAGKPFIAGINDLVVGRPN